MVHFLLILMELLTIAANFLFIIFPNIAVILLHSH